MTDSDIIGDLVATIDRLSRIVEKLTTQNSTAASPDGYRASGGTGGGRARSSQPQGSPPSGSRPQQAKERTKYAWSKGGKPPAPDDSANKLSEGQSKRLWAIAKSKDLDLPTHIEAMYGRGLSAQNLDWKQGTYLADAMEDGWTSVSPGEPEPEWENEPF